MFPRAAVANHSIFYDASGRARSIREVYNKLTGLFDSARGTAFAQGDVSGTTSTATAFPAAPPLPPPTTVKTARVKAVPNERLVRVASAAPPAPSPRPTRPTPPASIPSPPDTAGVTQAFAKANEKLPPPAPRPSFQSMFTDRVSQPLAQAVNNLWGPPTPGAPSTAQSVRVLDLFTDTRPNERKLLGDKA